MRHILRMYQRLRLSLVHVEERGLLQQRRSYHLRNAVLDGRLAVHEQPDDVRRLDRLYARSIRVNFKWEGGRVKTKEKARRGTGGEGTHGEGDEGGVDEDVDDVPEAVLEVVPRDRLRVHPCGPGHDDGLCVSRPRRA